VRTAVTGDSLKEFFFELERIRSEGVPETELEDAKNYLMGVFPIRVETQGALIGQIAAQRIYGLPDDYLETYCENVSKVTAEEVERAADLYVHPESIAMVIVGDAEEVLPLAKDYCGDIEVFDTDGKPKDFAAYSKQESEAPDASVEGRWDLTVSAQGQELSLILDLEDSGGGIEGHLESMLGQGTIRDAAVNGDRFKASIVTEMLGQELEIGLKCSIEGDEMMGTLTIPMMPDPLEFRGRRVDGD